MCPCCRTVPYVYVLVRHSYIGYVAAESYLAQTL